MTEAAATAAEATTASTGTAANEHAEPVLAGIPDLGRPVKVSVVALTLDNFKSFAKKTTIPLRDGFTTVSGPNGSGKSNVIDAVQFVLGIATSKGMRAERLTDLICTEGTKPVARVSLVIDGTFEQKDGRTVNRRLEVTRVVRRIRSGAQAHYELDGTAVRLVDLHDLMRDLGFPTSGQNIVLQGDVVRLTSMGGVARRQVLDELAGARDFDKRIALAHEELGAADRHTEDTRLILRELGEQLGVLKAQRDQALTFQQLAGRKASCESDLVVLEVQGAEVQARDARLALEACQKQHKTAARALEKRRAEEQEKQAALAAVEEELAQKSDEDRLAAVRQVEQLKGKVAATRDRGRQAREQEAALHSRLPNLERLVGEGRARIEHLEHEVEERAGHIDAREARHQQLTGRFEAATSTLRKNGADQIRAAEAVRATSNEADALRAREAELAGRDRTLGELASRREAELAMVRGASDEQGARRAELEQRGAEAARVHAERRAAHGKTDERRRALHKQVNDLRAGLEVARSRVARAESELAAAEARRQQAHALSGGHALQVIREEKLDGIHGTVADLIKFETKFAQALEAAAGGRLGWVVTTDDFVAKDAIELLKRTRAGRLSFAPLTKLRAPRIERDPPRGRSIVGYAVDLVSADSRYEELLRSVFTDTLVIEKLQDGLPLIGRYRMVTLDGDVLERHGLMTGGSASRGGHMLAAAAQAQEEIEQKKRALHELEKTLSAARGALARAEQELGEATETLATEQSALAEAEANLASLMSEQRRLEATAGPQGVKADALEADLTTARAEQAGLAGELAAVRARLAEVAERLRTLDRPEAGEAFEALTKQAQECEHDMRELELELDQLRAEQSTAQAERGVAQERLETSRRNLEEARAQLAERIAAAAAADAEAAELAAELKREHDALEALSAELTALTKRRDEARAAAEQARDAARAMAHELETLTVRAGQLEAELAQKADAAAALRKAAEAREIEVPPVEEAPDDLPRARRRIEQNLAKLEAEIVALGPINQLAIEQYDQVVARHAELEAKVATLETEKTQLRERIVDLEGKKKRAFLEAFERVSKAFVGTFAELARGEGRLRLESPQDPFAGGLIIEASPRGKKLKRLELMSGGEKSLTALAFIFALQEVNPAPFFVFDEVDQSLDGVNTEVLAEAIRARAGGRQYLVISHHRVMLERSRQTLGVTMRKGWGTVVTGVGMDGAAPEASAQAASVAVVVAPGEDPEAAARAALGLGK